MMERLSVFRGGFAREAARQLATEREGMAITLQLLSRLVSKSLLQADQARERYQIHELLRQYAQERLEGSGELAATQTAHASYTLDMLHQRGAAAKGGRGQKEALDAIEADFANIRAAWDWALKQGNLATIDQTLEALFWFSWIRSRELDGVELYLGAEAQFASDPDRYSNAAWRRIAARRIFLAMTASAWVSNHERLMEIEKILAMAQEDGDLAEIAFALFLQGLLQIQVSIPAALQSLKESQLLYHQLGETYYESQIMGEISFLHLATGFPEKRVEIARQQLELARKNEARLKWADAMGQIGFVAGMAGCYSEAEANYKEALPVFRELGDRFHISEYLIYLGELAFLAGDVTRARAWVTEGQALAMQFNIHSEQVRSQGVQSMILSAEEQYGQAADLCQDLMQYRDRLIPFAGFRGMAYALCGLGDFAAAKDHLNKALEMAAFMKAPGWQVQCLPAAALIAASEDRLERAIELLALAYHHPAGATGWLGKFPLVTRLRAHFEAKLSPEGLETAWEKGKGLDLGETVTALLEELG